MRVDVGGGGPPGRAAARGKIGLHRAIGIQHRANAGTGRPAGYRLRVQARSGLVRRIPWPARIGLIQTAYVTRNLVPLLLCESMEDGARDDRIVGIIKVLQITSVLGVAIRAMR